MKLNNYLLAGILLLANIALCAQTPDASYLKAKNPPPSKPDSRELLDPTLVTHLDWQGDFLQVKKIDLKYHNLTEVPALVLRCLNLEELDLAHNQITQIPQALTQLKHLKRLYLNNNQLATLPDFVPANLTQLEELFVQHNLRGFVLPQNISGLTQLKNLICSHVQQVPDGIWQLTNLQKLRLWYAGMTELPPAIQQLHNLEEICLRGNHLTQLPDELFGLKRLNYLSVGENKLAQMPDAVNNLPLLGYLGVFDNPMPQLPLQPQLLPNLQILRGCTKSLITV